MGNTESDGSFKLSKLSKRFAERIPFIETFLEKVILKYQQLAKDAQSSGDPVLIENYLQHADHYLRRFNELSERKDNFVEKPKLEEKSLVEEEATKDNLEKKDYTQT